MSALRTSNGNQLLSHSSKVKFKIHLVVRKYQLLVCCNYLHLTVTLLSPYSLCNRIPCSQQVPRWPQCSCSCPCMTSFPYVWASNEENTADIMGCCLLHLVTRRLWFPFWVLSFSVSLSTFLCPSLWLFLPFLRGNKL